MAKLTLSIADEVIERAKRFAKRRGTDQPPMLARMRGLLHGEGKAAHRRHLARKYR